MMSIMSYIVNSLGEIMSFGDDKLKCTLLFTSSE